MNHIAVITTFPNFAWEVYAKNMLQSFVANWPAEVPLLVQTDDDLLKDQIARILRPQDAHAPGVTQEHADFVTRNKKHDDPQDYRRQVTRFSHKVFAIHRALTAIKQEKATGKPSTRYLIWMDADTVTTRQITISDIKECLPKEGDAVAYMGRKDWPHSECGWLAFDLEKGGDAVIEAIYGLYVSDQVLKLQETHDSWVFDHVRKSQGAPPMTNLTDGKPGMDIWQHSPMAKWSQHFKGPVAKGMAQPKQPRELQGGKNFIIQTKNSLPDEEIHAHIKENQSLISRWVTECAKTDEQIVVVSAGPQLWPEDVLQDYRAGKKIVAVKHALEPLRDAGIRPWACILLDPRPHVYDFVAEPDTGIIWFVASQVDPKVTARLLAKGCAVWGYHASVGASEGHLTALQPQAVIGGGSATATRGLFLLRHLGFHRMKLYGYDLCFPDKPDLNAADELGQPKYMEMSVGWNNPLSPMKKCFWTKPELIAQFEEINLLIQNNVFDLEAVGDGIVPFILKGKVGGELRAQRLRDKMGIAKPVKYQKLLGADKWTWKTSSKPTSSLTRVLRTLLPSRRKTR